MQQVRNIAILGSTGSIGQNTLDVVASTARVRAVGLTAHRNTESLLTQAERHRPAWIVVVDPDKAAGLDTGRLPRGTTLLRGPEGVERLAAEETVDLVVAAIVGSAGLRGAWAALEAGKPLALANKETLVMAGSLVTGLAAERQVPILPIDSEHSAIFQALQNGRREEVRRIVLTASGGPFRTFTAAQLREVTVEQALAHPTWAMGPKITVDSATMMNKALEIIEARWLFDFPANQIDVVVHPQSIVHSLVEYRDGSVIAQLSPPDMRLPIQYALSYPERWEGPATKLDLTQPLALEFFPPDPDRFPALRLGREVAERGGTAGAVLNAANEAAVARFLAGDLRFTEIVAACEAVLNNHDFDPRPSLATLQSLDRWARHEIQRWKSCSPLP